MSKLSERIFKPPAPFYNFIFVPLFYSLAAVYAVVTRADHSLHSYTSRYIGWATLENFDVASRITQFYTSVLLFIAVFTVLYFILAYMIRKKNISSAELHILNLSSFCGLILLYTRVLGTEIYPVLRMLLVIHFALFSCIAMRNMHAKQSETNEHIFAWILIISFGLVFAVKKAFMLFGLRADFSFTLFMWVAFTILLVLLRKQVYSPDSRSNKRIILLFEPLVWLPLLCVIADEAYMILNQRNIFISPAIVFVVMLVLLMAVLYLRIRGKTAEIEHVLSRRHFPVLIIGLSAFTFYSPVQNATTEMFEIANGVLPMQQLFEFGKMPLVDTFSSHMVSDFFMMLLYTVFNGYDNLCFSCYDFIFYVAASVLAYYLVRKITGNGYWAFFIALFYPYAEHLVPVYVSLALLSLLALINALNKRNFKSYTLLFFIAVFLVVWRVDLGFANAATLTATLFLLFAGNNYGIEKKALFKSLLWVLSATAIVFILFLLLKGKSIIYNMQSALDYFSSAQSYGYKELAATRDVISYSLNYFFPVLVLAALGYALYRLFTTDNTKTKMLSVILCYLSVFYFLNFQRGLVRHGLVEQWDIPLTSFAFLIFMVWILLILEKKNVSYLFITAMAVMTLVISRYKFPEEELKRGGLYNSVYERIKHFPAVEHTKGKIVRMPVEENFASANYGELGSFMDKNFSRRKWLGESYADFSNTPMLYYYLHKRSPHFFAQSPISYHSEALQRRWINEIESSNTKWVLFSSYPEIWFDATDGVPNALRHYLIAEHLYMHFHPGYILNNKTMWIRNNTRVEGNAMDTVYSVTDVKKYAFDDAVLKGNVLETGNHAPSVSVNDIAISPKNEKKYFLILNAVNAAPGEENIYFYFNHGSVPGKESKWRYTSGNNYVFSVIQVLPGDTITGIRFSLTKNSQFVPNSLHIVECDYIPDYYSAAPRDFDLKELPYVWGKQDEKFKETKHKTFRQLTDSHETIPNQMEQKFFFNPVEKSGSGCYVIIRAGKRSEKEARIIMNYGAGDSKSGGFTFSLPDSEVQNYVIRVSTQYNWYSKANNWISVYPVGGDIDIEKIQIVSGD